MEWRKYTGGLPTDVGTYTVKASFAERKNFVAAEAELTYTINPSLFGNDKLTGALTYEGRDGGAIGNHKIIQGTLAAPSENYTLTVASGVMFEITKLSLEKAIVTANSSFTYTGAAQVPTVNQVKDTLSGTLIPSEWWETLLDAITFGHYAVKEYTVTIESNDTGGSEIREIQYAIIEGDAQYTDASELAKATGINWREYDSNDEPKVPVGKKCVVYAKLTDKAGNVTYISTEGILLDKTPPTEGCEYSFDGKTWSEDNVKTGVKAGETVTGYGDEEETALESAGSIAQSLEGENGNSSGEACIILLYQVS